MPTLTRAYAAAQSLAPGRRAAALKHGPVRPRWSADGACFWYATTGEDGTRHLLVEAATGERRPLFDHDALGEALAPHVDAALDRRALPLADLRFDVRSGTVSFESQAQRWRWDARAGVLERLGEAFGPSELPAPDGTLAIARERHDLKMRAAGERGFRALTTDGGEDQAWGGFLDSISQLALRAAPQPLRPIAIWSPDSQRFAVLREDLRRVGQLHLLQSVHDSGVRPKLHTYRYPLPGDAELPQFELWFFDRDGARVRARLPPIESSFASPLVFGQARWTADGRWFLMLQGDRHGRRLVLWRIDPLDGSVAKLHEEEGTAVVRASPSLAEPAMFDLLPDGRVLWWSQRDGWGHLYLVAPNGGVRPLTRGDWQVRAVLRCDSGRGELVVVGGGREPGVDPYYDFAYRSDLDGTEPTLLTPAIAHHQFAYPGFFDDGTRSLSPCGRWLVDAFSTVHAPPVSELRDSNGAKIATLETADAAGSRPDGLPLPEPFTVRSADGAHELWGVLYRPLDFDPTRRYRVVEVIYGAPQTAVANKAWLPSPLAGFAEQLAALGFVAVVVDGPGTPYRSHAFQLASHGRIESCGGLVDHVHAIRTLATTRRWMDVARVGIVGGSGGGYATVRAMAEFPDFYAVGAALCGNHDQAAYVAGWAEGYHGPFETALYERQSNVGVAGRITGDLLLVHGDMDENVHPSMTLRVVDAMVKAGRPVDLLIVPNAGHDLGPLPFVQRRVFDHFVEKLMRRRPPRWPRQRAPRKPRG